MIRKKICMLGSFAVGKTSLVARFVTGIFSDKYLTTIGVKIDQKLVNLVNQDVHLMLWDIHGEDEFQKLRMSYLRGSSGYLLVVDGTRRVTLEKAVALQQSVAQALGNVPFIVVFNKSDLTDEWEIDPTAMAACAQKGWRVITTSAKTGQGVEEAFVSLAKSIMETYGPV